MSGVELGGMKDRQGFNQLKTAQDDADLAVMLNDQQSMTKKEKRLRLNQIDKLRNDLSQHQNEAIVLLTHAIEKQAQPPKGPTMGNPAALGLAGFASTTFILSAYNTQLLDPVSLKMVLPMALWFGGTGQLLAGLLEFLIGNMFGATAFVSYGCFWLTYATLVEFMLPEMAAAGASAFRQNEAIAFYLMMWLIFSTYMMFGSFKTNLVLAAIFITLVPTLILLVAGHYSFGDAGSTNTIKAGGYFGLICASLAWYGSAANVINGSYGKVILPVGGPLIPNAPAPAKENSATEKKDAKLPTSSVSASPAPAK